MEGLQLLTFEKMELCRGTLPTIAAQSQEMDLENSLHSQHFQYFRSFHSVSTLVLPVFAQKVHHISGQYDSCDRGDSSRLCRLQHCRYRES